jgi:hypothetical protein
LKVAIVLKAGANQFAEDKDEARRIRLEEVMPALARGDSIVLDFKEVTHATQSYVHALIGEVLRKHGDSALRNLEFKNCSSTLRSLISLVVDYTLGGFDDYTLGRFPEQSISPAGVSSKKSGTST